MLLETPSVKKLQPTRTICAHFNVAATFAAHRSTVFHTCWQTCVDGKERTCWGGFSPGNLLWWLASQLYPLNCVETDAALLSSRKIKPIRVISAPKRGLSAVIFRRSPLH